jgi:HlyD family secretion protein
MDEATSALDGGTENAVMEAITALAGKKTIILIAHRLSTVRNCDMIYLLEDGRIKYMGTYECLIRENQTFREFAGVDQ